MLGRPRPRCRSARSGWSRSVASVASALLVADHRAAAGHAGGLPVAGPTSAHAGAAGAGAAPGPRRRAPRPRRPGPGARPASVCSSTLVLDAPSALLLGVAAFLWLTAGAYAATYLRADPHRERFAVCWLLTLTGSLGVFMAGDLATFYVLFALVSLAAYGLVVQDGHAQGAPGRRDLPGPRGDRRDLPARRLRAAGRCRPGDSLAIRAVTAALPGSPWFAATIVACSPASASRPASCRCTSGCRSPTRQHPCPPRPSSAARSSRPA